jgi:predicted alpha-1,6-mannanase (GH76 family)
MPTVPNWIAKAVIYESRDHGSRADITPVLWWRATATQVVVECKRRGERVERRFRLDDLREVGRGRYGAAELHSADDERVVRALAQNRKHDAVSTLNGVIDDTRLDASSMDAEQIVLAIDKIQRAATKALADLGEVL